MRQQVIPQPEVLTKELLTQLFNRATTPKSLCPKCKGRGIYEVLEDSKFEGFQVKNWHPCECQSKKAKPICESRF